MNFASVSGCELSDFRKTLGLNQTEFWGRIGVTQSCGSRYEAGRKIPHPIQILLDIVYGDYDLDFIPAPGSELNLNS